METAEKIYLALFSFFLFVLPCYAQQESDPPQAAGSSTSYLVDTGEGYRFFQTIVIPDIPNTIQYDVEIERIEGRETYPVEKISTDVNWVEVSLNAGLYRYRYTAVNRMGIIEGISQWQEFIVLAGSRPEPESYRPFYGLFFEMSDPDGILIIYGKEMFPESEFALIKKGKYFNWTGVSLEGRNDVIKPNRVYVEGTSGETSYGDIASLSFTRGSLTKGTYVIFIRNPGGLWTTFGEVHVGFRKNTDFTLSFGYSPMIAAFDINNAPYIANNYSGGAIRQIDRFNPLGFNLRLGWMPVKTNIGSFGLELQYNSLFDNHYQYSGYNDYFFVQQFFYAMSDVSLNLLYQSVMSDRWQHNVRAGAGFFGEQYHDFNNEITPFSVNFNLGYSTQFFIWKNLYLEAGLDLVYAVSFNRDMPLNHLMIRPGVNIGWQFGRWSEYSEVAAGEAKGLDFSVPVTHPPKSEHIISVNWHPMILLSGFNMYEYKEDGTLTDFLWPVNPLGFSLRYAYLPYRWENNKLGFRFELSFLDHVNRLKEVSHEYRALDFISQSFLGIIYQRVLTDKFQMNAHTGLGISNPYNYVNPFTGPAFAMNMGVSVQYFFRKDFFFEGGIDIALILSDDMKSALRPGIAVGYQFSRDNETGLRLKSPGKLIDPFEGLSEDMYRPAAGLAAAAEEEIEESDEPRRIQRLKSDNSPRYNSFNLSLGTSFTEPLVIGTLNICVAAADNLFIEGGFDIGFMSIHKNVKQYLTIYPFLNLGVFLPFSGKGGFLFGAGGGYMQGNSKNDYESGGISYFAANFFAGFNIGNVFHITYTIRTDFNFVGSKLSFGYVIRLE